MTEDTTGQPGSPAPSEPSDSAMGSDLSNAAGVPAPPDMPAAEAPDPPARMPGAPVPAYAPPPPDPVIPPVVPPSPDTIAAVPDAAPAMAPIPASAAPSDDTNTWEVPPAAVTAGAAAASQWNQPTQLGQPAPAPPPPAPPAPTWQQPTQATPPPPQAAPPPAQTWQQPAPQQPAQQWQAAPPPPQAWQQQQAQQPRPPQPYQQQPYAQPQQYQQPYGQAQQPYGQPYAQPYAQNAAYAAAYGQPAVKAPFGNSPLAAFAGLLLLIFGIGVAALGVFSLTQGSEFARFLARPEVTFSILGKEQVRTILSAMPGILIVSGSLMLLAAVGALAHRGWGRWLGVLFALMGAVAAGYVISVALQLSSAFTVQLLITVVALVGFILIVLGLLAGGSHFRRRTPAPG